MKWIQKFENFNKDTKYTNDDIINCIKNNCNIYSNDVPGHPDINDKVALSPVCIDNDGIITIDIDSKGVSDIEIPISSISKIDIKNSINEAFEMSDYLYHFTKELNKKGLSISLLLEIIDYADLPVKDVNYLTISLKTNMLKYLTNNKLEQFRKHIENRLQNHMLDVYHNRLQTEARIGRVISKILNTIDKSYFEYKSNIKLEIINGGQYDRTKDCQDFFQIYVTNKNVSLLILKDKEKLFGRALLWKLDNGKYFMDRVYTILEPDEIIFINYAIKNGYYYRSNGTNEKINYYFNGEVIDGSETIMSVNLDYSDFTYYPYLDTFKYLNIDEKILSNNPKRHDYILTSTEGRWEGYYDD